MPDTHAIINDVSLLQPDMQTALKMLEAKGWKFRVVETIRTLDRQKMLKASGKSRTLRSNHIVGMAADIYPYPMGYQITREQVAKLHGDWIAIAVELGYPKTRLLAWDALHVSLNNGVRI